MILRLENILNVLNKITPILMGAYVFLNPFAFKLTALSEICFYLSTAFTAILVFYKRIEFNFKTPLTIPFVLLLGWAFIGLFFAVYKGNSIHDFLRYLVKPVMVFYLLVNLFNTKKRLEYLGWIVIVSGSLFLVGLTVYYYFILNNSFIFRVSLTNIMNNEFGFIALPVLVLSLYYFGNVKGLLIKILLIGAIFVSTILIIQSMGSIFGLVLSLCVLFLAKRKTIMAYTGVLIIIFAAVNLGFMGLVNQASVSLITSKAQSDSRIGIWALYINVIKDYPVTGIGYGLEMWQYQDFWDKYASRVPDSILSPDIKKNQKLDPHNMFISIAVHLGIIGLLIFIYLICAVFKISFVLIKKGRDDWIKEWAIIGAALLVGYLAKSMSEEALSNIGALMFYYTMALIVIVGSLNREACTQADLH